MEQPTKFELAIHPRASNENFIAWPSATAAASSDILPKPAFCPATLDTFAFEAVPIISRAQITAYTNLSSMSDSRR